MSPADDKRGLDGGRVLSLQYRQPKVAEMLAATLRERILDNDLPEGSELPRSADLAAEFRVSGASIREAMRILETEGLLTVRRGSLGGAIVNKPTSTDVSRIVGFVLHSWRTRFSDIRVAIAILEPMCAAMCAERADRHQTVLPGLFRTIAGARVAMGDWATFEARTFEFHDILIDSCGNDSIRLVAGALDNFRNPGRITQSTKTNRSTVLDNVAAHSRETLDAHTAIAQAIAEGDTDRAAKLTRSHDEGAREWIGGLDGEDPVVAVNPMRGEGFTS